MVRPEFRAEPAASGAGPIGDQAASNADFSGDCGRKLRSSCCRFIVSTARARALGSTSSPLFKPRKFPNASARFASRSSMSTPDSSSFSSENNAGRSGLLSKKGMPVCAKTLEIGDQKIKTRPIEMTNETTILNFFIETP